VNKAATVQTSGQEKRLEIKRKIIRSHSVEKRLWTGFKTEYGMNK
jgi:hypothetical protein